MSNIKHREFISLLRGSRMAALRARAAAGDACDGLSKRCIAPFIRAHRNRIPARPKGNWLRRYRNIPIEYRCAQNEMNRLPVLAAEFVNRQVMVIAASSTRTVF